MAKKKAGKHSEPRSDKDATLAKSIESAADGDRILVSPGVYTRALVLRRPIRLVAEESAEETIFRIVGPAAITIKASGCELVGLTVESSGGAAVVVTASDTMLQGCKLRATAMLPARTSLRARRDSIGHDVSPERELLFLRTDTARPASAVVLDVASGQHVDQVPFSDFDLTCCAVRVSGDGARVTLRGCELSGVGLGLLVEERASASLEGGLLAAAMGSTVTYGARLVARKSVFQGGNDAEELFAHHDASVDLEGCQIFGYDAPSIELAWDSELVMRRCELVSHGEYGNGGVSLLSASRAMIEACTFSHHLMAMTVMEDCRAEIVGGSIRDAKREAISVSGDASVSVRETEIVGSGTTALSVLTRGKLTARGMTIRDASGSSVRVEAASVDLDDCEIQGGMGLDVRRGGTLTMRGGRLQSARASGLIVHEGGTASVHRVRVIGCPVGVLARGALAFTGGVIEDADHAVVVVGAGASGTLTGVEISGAAVSSLEVLSSAHVHATTCVLRDSTGGVGVEGSGRLEMQRCQILRIAGVGVAVLEDGELTLSRCGIHHVKGDALLVSSASAALAHCRLTSSGGDGVVSQLGGSVSVSDSLVEGHARFGIWTQGGGQALLSSSKIVNNRTAPLGGEAADMECAADVTLAAPSSSASIKTRRASPRAL